MKHQTKLTFKVLSVILCLALIFQFSSLTLNAFAQEINEKHSAGTETSSNENGKFVDEPFEMKEKRGETVKQFRMTDGSVLAVDYGIPVHYESEEGVYEEYENTLTKVGTNYSTKDGRIGFSQKIADRNSLFALRNHGVSVQLSLIGAKVGTKAQVSTLPIEKGTDEIDRLTAFPQPATKILYQDVFSGVDVEYILFGDSVKENIIVKKRLDTYYFDFILQTDNVTPVMKGRTILLLNESGETVYTLPAPYMKDAKGVVSDQVSYTISEGKDGRWKFTVEASPKFLNDPQTVYPVTIDPTIEGASPNKFLKIDAEWSNTPGIDMDQIFSIVSYQRIYLDYYLGYIPSDAYVSSAKLKLLYPYDPKNENLCVYTVPYSWNANTDMWDTMEHNYGKLLDTKEMNYRGEYYWDILPAIAGAVQEPTSQHGVVFMTDTNTLFWGNIEYNSYYMRPRLIVTYTEMLGVEDYYSLYRQNAGAAGSFAVNLATGKLTMELPLLSLYNNVLPMNVGLIADGKNRMPRLNIHQTITEESYTDHNGDTQTMYRYTDSDGSPHYFKPYNEGTQYEDEDGLLLTLTEDNDTGNLIITDDGGNVMVFADIADLGDLWYLVSIIDEDGNKLRITHSDEMPDELLFIPKGQATGVDRITIEYDDNYNPTDFSYVIKESAHEENDIIETIALTYNSAGQPLTLCRKINAETISSAEWQYDSNGRLVKAINKMGNHIVSAIGYTYSGNCVSTVTEYGENLTEGQSVLITYRTRGAEIRTSGADDILNTDDDIITRYVLDSAGRTTGTYSLLADGTEVHGGSGGQYTNPAEDGIRSNNRIKQVVNYAADNDSYLINGGFEKGTDGWTLTRCSIGSDSMDAYRGFASLGLYCRNAPFAQAKQNVVLTKGTYTFSAFVQGYNTENHALKIIIGKTIGNTIAEVASEWIVERQEGSFDYVQNVFTFSVDEEDEQEYTISIEIVSSGAASESSHFSIDNVTLVRGRIVAPLDLVEYGGFDVNRPADGYDLSDYWSNGGTVVNSGLIGNAIELSAQRVTDTASVSQEVYYAPDWFLDYGGWDDNLVPARTFLLSGYAKITPGNASYCGLATITLRREYRWYDNSLVIEESTISFDSQVEGWQYLAIPVYVTMEDDTDWHDFILERMTVVLEVSRGVGTVLFDNISLIETPDNFSGASYNEDGKVTVTKNVNYYTYYFYDSIGRLTQTADTYGNLQTISYSGNTHKVRLTEYSTFNIDAWTDRDNPVPESISTLQRREFNYYNSKGFLYETCLAVIGEGEVMTTMYTYEDAVTSKNYGAALTSTDENGYTVTNTYDDQYRLIQTSGSDGKGTHYLYNAKGEIQTVVPTHLSGLLAVADMYSASAEYTYEPTTGRLSTIKTQSSNYAFEYDEYGNTVQITLNSQILVSYSYAAGNGKISTITYGSGDTIGYHYDTLDRISSVWYNGVESIRYIYGRDGNLISVEDLTNGKEDLFTYDGYGNLIDYISTVSISENGFGRNVIEYRETDTYAENNRVYSSNRLVDSRVYGGTTALTRYRTYNYNPNGFITKITESDIYNLSNRGLYTVEYDQDGIERLSSRKVTKDNIILRREYQYDNYNLSYRIDSVKDYIGHNYNKTIYTYDDAGNITYITYGQENSEYNYRATVRYRYDDLNQLIREDNGLLGKTYVYYYDNSGNRTCRKTFNYTTGDTDPLTPESTEFYDYYEFHHDATDRISFVGGYSVQYDNIGNPTSYRGNTLTWNRRSLMSYGNNTYTYNSDGIRIQKTVNGVEHHYILNGMQIQAEVIETGKTIYYFYDQFGVPTMFRVDENGTQTWYLYETNIQGDVIGILTTSGTRIATYVYDAWGRVTVSGSNLAVANLNPIRYRGYYYDSETQLYYLQSRYYDPATGRFISADGVENLGIAGTLTDKNLFAYCDNNPIMRADEDGEFWGTITGAIFGAISGGINAALNDNNIWAGIGIGAATGAIAGLAVDLSIATGGLAGVAIAATGGALGSVAEDLLNNYVNGNDNNWGEIIYNATFSAVTNGVSFGMGLDNGVKTGAKTIKQAFQYAGQNFAKSTIANSAGRVPKLMGARLRNLAKNTLNEFVGAALTEFGTGLFNLTLRRFMGLS